MGKIGIYVYIELKKSVIMKKTIDPAIFIQNQNIELVILKNAQFIDCA